MVASEEGCHCYGSFWSKLCKKILRTNYEEREHLIWYSWLGSDCVLLVNGIAPLFVHKAECYLSICQLNPPPVENFLSRFVFKYRNQPDGSAFVWETGVSSCSIVNNKQPCHKKIHVKIHRIEVSWRDYSPEPQIIQNQSIHSDQQHSQKLQLKIL